jgi:methyl-accepting chemotaxis protein
VDFNLDSQVIRRQDLIDLGDAFKEALAPLSTVVEHMKVQNARLELVTWWIGAVGFISLLSLVLHLWAISRIESTAVVLNEAAEQLIDMRKQLDGTSAELDKVKKTAQATDAKVERAAQSAPKLELVAQPDPARARKAPVVLRVVAPAASGQSASPLQGLTRAIEIPLPAESAR